MQKVKTKTANAVQEYRYVEKRDLGKRLLAFMLDVTVALSPMMIWNIIMLAVLGSLLSISGITLINIVIAVLLVFSIFFLNALICGYTKGQSLGMYLYDFQIISNTGKKANTRQMRLRDLIGFAIPFVVLMMFTSIFGVMVYWMINGIVVLIDKKHRSMIDFLTRTCVVVNLGMKTMESPVTEPTPASTPLVSKAPISPDLNHVDLHIHSNFSADGEYNIEEIFQYAKRNGMKTISITDLNTTKSNAIALRMSELYGIRYVSGIEIQAQHDGIAVNVLGYFIQSQNDLYTTIENDSLLAEKRASMERVHLFEQHLKKTIYVEELLENNRFQRISGEMIAKHVLNHPHYQDCDVLQPYLVGKLEQPYQQLAADYFGEGKSCHVDVKRPSLKDVLDVIALSEGIAVLADSYTLYHKAPQVFDAALSMGIAGIEVFRPEYTRKQMAEMMKLAKDRKLLITCGSDFYRENSNKVIGDCHCPKEAEGLIDRIIYAKE